eukprot:COSAG06_NODE_943_length_11375_cov_11.840635_11_plen_132_part_00
MVLENGTTLMAGRTCSGPERPWVAKAPAWTGPFESIDHDSQPFPMLNAEDRAWLPLLKTAIYSTRLTIDYRRGCCAVLRCADATLCGTRTCVRACGCMPAAFMWRDTRGNYHMLHHWQEGDHNRYYNGGHS